MMSEADKGRGMRDLLIEAEFHYVDADGVTRRTRNIGDVLKDNNVYLGQFLHVDGWDG